MQELMNQTLAPLREAAARIRAMPCRKLVFPTTIAIAVPVTSVGALVMINFWTRAFPASVAGSNCSVMLVIAVGNTAGYTSIFLPYLLLRRPRLRFLLDPQNLVLLFGAAALLTLTGMTSISATPHTPLLMQALLTATTPPVTMLCTKLLFSEERKYLNPLVLAACVCILAGVLVGAGPRMAGSQSMDGSAWGWTGIFALSVLPNAVFSVVTAKFLRRVTDPPAKNEDATSASDAAMCKPALEEGEAQSLLLNNSSPLQQPTAPPAETTDKVTALLAFLTFTPIIAVGVLMLLVPLDAIPWFGTADSVREAYSSLKDGLACTFDPSSSAPVCGKNYQYMLGYMLAWVLNGLSCTIFMAYSPTLMQMMSQLTAPLTALMLLCAPGLAPGAAPTLWSTLLAILFLVAGAGLYALWEEATRRQSNGGDSDGTHGSSAAEHHTTAA